MLSMNESDIVGRSGSYHVEEIERARGLDGVEASEGGVSRDETAATTRDGIFGKAQRGADRLRDFLAGTCCLCLNRVPGFAVVVVALLTLIALLALVPLVFVLTAPTSDAMVASNGSVSTRSRDLVRESSGWPDNLDDDEPLELARVIGAGSSLHPPNVTLCENFGFSCTSNPDIVIGTKQRCDGHPNCPDGSDEEGCQDCHTSLSCAKTDSGLRHCLRGTDLCDGVSQCSDELDESSAFCVQSKEDCPSPRIFCGGRCIPKEMACDGDAHCEDESDELNCSSCNGGAILCPATQRCIPLWERCDGQPQCPDESDELNCDCVTCSGSNRALCVSDDSFMTRCVLRSQLCDGVAHCPLAMDEQQCAGTCPAMTLRMIDESNPDYEPADKEPQSVVCAGGIRYPIHLACSGHAAGCEASCPEGLCDLTEAFACPAVNGSHPLCISRSLVCDGRSDCPDGADEESCSKVLISQEECAKTGGFKCILGSKCVSKSSRCDGVTDCSDGSDEAGCQKCNVVPGSVEPIYCAKDERCLSSLSRCDGRVDCSDGSDEANCTCEECGRHAPLTYMCSGAETSSCFRRSEVCSPNSRCPNATMEDRLYCAAARLRSSLSMF